MLSVLEHVPSIEHPRAARFIEMARPMPLEAPVITATLPVRSCSRSRELAIVQVTQEDYFGEDEVNKQSVEVVNPRKEK